MFTDRIYHTTKLFFSFIFPVPFLERGEGAINISNINFNLIFIKMCQRKSIYI